MVAYSFKAQFAAPILAGTKRQTIRATRKRHACSGETLQLFTGMRTRFCRLIGTATCSAVFPITMIFPNGPIECGTLNPDAALWTWHADKLDDFAIQDGFCDFAAMRAFWADEYPGVDLFTGVLVQWTDFLPAQTKAAGREPGG